MGSEKRFHPAIMTLAWPVAALALLVVFNLAFTPGFFGIELRDGRFFGTPIDVLNHAAKVAIVAIGMTLVIATGGVDLSVGAVVAISGAVAAMFVTRSQASFPLVILAALAAGGVAGLCNGFLVARLRLQPIVATLVLMVAGRGVAQLITDGLIITFEHRALSSLANTAFAFIPIPAWIALALATAVGLFTRRTAAGMFVEAVGDNDRACRYAGVNDRAIKLGVYAFCGVCAGLAGLVECSYIKAADANNAGLFLELDAILAVVIGGTSLSGGRFSLTGSLVGAILIQTLTKTMYMHDVSADVAPLPKAIAVLAVCTLQSPVVKDRIAGMFSRGSA
ncbi:MAG: ABC transporter permease [Phycisphaerales bacterium]|nr:ABC transporter permease [Phycisphaerales bacterium]